MKSLQAMLRLLPWLALTAAGHANVATVAVATNFKQPAEALVRLFQSHTASHEIRLVSGSTGKLYTQITQGAPFDVFLAADTERPSLLERSGHAAAHSRRTYAVGQLALLGVADRPTAEQLSDQTLALANPSIAPYGLAATQVLRHFNDAAAGTRKRILTENVGQAYTLFATGNVPLAFVARSLLRPHDVAWLVPEHLHDPIRQQMILLKRGQDNPAAQAFYAFLQSSPAQKAIRQFGYTVETS